MLRLFFALLIPTLIFCDDINIVQTFADLSITTAEAGQEPDRDTQSGFSYQITSVDQQPSDNRVIRASIAENLPQGAILRIALEPPGTGTSNGIVTITTAPIQMDLVTGIVPGDIVINTNFNMTVEMQCTTEVGPQVFSETLTLEIVVP